MALELTQRDYQVFEMLSISNVATMKQIQKIYDTKKYHYTRIDQLVKERYLIKNGPYIELAKGGADLMGISKYNFRNQEVKKYYLPIADLYLNLENIDIKSNKQMRDKYSLNRKTYFRCGLEMEGEDYVVYFLSESATRQFIAHIQNELAIMAANGQLLNAIVFAANNEVKSMFDVESKGQRRVFLLPYQGGIDMLNWYCSDEIQIKRRAIIGESQPCAYPFADFQSSDGFICDLCLNNMVRRKALLLYYSTRHNPEPVTIICSRQEQLPVFADYFPKANLIRIK